MSERRGLILKLTAGSALGAAALLSACGGGESQPQVLPSTVSSSPVAAGSAPESTIRITPTSTAERTIVPFVPTQAPTREITPTPARPADAFTPVVPAATSDKAVELDGKDQFVEVDATGMNIDNGFRLKADINLSDSFPLSGGDTIASIGDDEAFYARSLSTRCLGKVGALLDGQDVCTNVSLIAGQWYNYEFDFDGKSITFFINGQQVDQEVWVNGALKKVRGNVIIGRRPGLTNRAPLGGLVDNFQISTGSKTEVNLNFDNGFVDSSPNHRVVTPNSNPTLVNR